MIATEERRQQAASSPLAALMRAHHAVSSRLDDILEGHGLSTAKLGVLRQLAEGSLPLGALAQRQSCVRSNITQLIDRMEGEGMVRRLPAPDDRRVTLAEITDSGRARLHAGLAAQAEAEGAVLASFSEEDVGTLTHLLDRLAGDA